MKILFVAAVIVFMAGCTWVKLEEAAQSVRVARPSETLSACRKVGEISVSVRDKVGFYERDPIKVRDELESLARNEALHLPADTLQALGEPVAGEQRFAAYRCGSAAVRRTTTTPSTAADPPATIDRAETFPIREE